jgi:uncharacterized protein (TIGR03086 family)
MTISPDATGPTATTARSMLPAAADRFGALVHAVPADAWDRPTPCGDWSVRDLVNHVVAGHRWVPPLLGGSTLAEVRASDTGDVLGDRPAAAWDAAIAASMRAWAMAREDQEVSLSPHGPTPAGEYAEQVLADLVVHGWDLGRGIGAEPVPDDGQAAHVLAYLEPRVAGWTSAGVFDDPVPTSRTDALSRLVALTGRDPDWQPA